MSKKEGFLLLLKMLSGSMSWSAKRGGWWQKPSKMMVLFVIGDLYFCYIIILETSLV